MNHPNVVNHTNEATPAASADAATKQLKSHLVELSGPGGEKAQVLLVPDGVRPRDVKTFLDEYRTAPERRQGAATFQDLDSFCEHATRFADDDSVLFAQGDSSDPLLISVIDYHRKGAEGAPRFGKHRGIYVFPVSDEWRAWKAMNGHSMGQSTFAEFLEDRIVDVADPAAAGDTAKALIDTLGGSFATPSKLLELSRDLSVNIGLKIQRAQSLATGEIQLTYVRQHQDETGQPLKVPTAFLVNVPVFRNGDLYQLSARLRYRVNEHTVVWFYELHGVERTFDHAFREACDKAQRVTGLPLFIGSPER